MINLKLSKIIQTCDACPSQWNASDENGTDYYIRYRWGRLSVNKGGVYGVLIFEKELGDEYSGFMTTDEMLHYTGFYV